MSRLLKPVTRERMAEITRARVGENGSEQLSLEDAGLVSEVRDLLYKRGNPTQK